MSSATQTDGAGASRSGSGVVWARVEDGFHVGSRIGEFVGYIDRQRDGRHLAYDSRSQCIGAFVKLTDAMRALSSPPAPSEDRPPVDLWEVR